MIVEHLKHTPYVVNHPEMYEAFNIKSEQSRETLSVLRELIPSSFK
jgi:hypothetical protein